MKKTHMEQIECFTEGTLNHQETRELILTLSGKPELVSQLQDNLYMDTLLEQHQNGENKNFYKNLMQAIEERSKPEQVLLSSSTHKFQATSKVLARTRRKKKASTPVIAYLTGLSAVAAIIIASVVTITPTQTSNLIISSIEGSGTIYRKGEFLSIKQGMPIFKGDSVSATKGSLLINFQNEASFIELSDDSTIRIDYDTQKVGSQKIIYVEYGNSKYTIQKQPLNNPMFVHSKTASIKVVGTVFKVNPHGNKTSIYTIKGLINVTNNISGDKFDLPQGYKVKVNSKELPEIVSFNKNDKPRILSYSIIDPNKGEVIDKLIRIKNNAILKMSDLPQTGYNIRVNISNHSKVDRVKFVLINENGDKILTQNEKIYPYMMAGDSLKGALEFNYEFDSIKALYGNYLLKTSVYDSSNKEPLSITTFKYSIK